LLNKDVQCIDDVMGSLSVNTDAIKSLSITVIGGDFGSKQSSSRI